MSDIRLAWRGLRRARGFTAAAVFTLAIGMAGTTAMFALIRGVLLQPLPLREPDRIVVSWKEHPTTGSLRWRYRRAEFDLIRSAGHIFSEVAAVGYAEPSQVTVFDDNSTAYLLAARVSGDFFGVLGVGPVLGRTLGPDDDRKGSEPVLVLTYGYWQRRYGGSADVLGRGLTIGERRFSIVGVMPPDVEYPRAVEAWMSIEASTTTRNPTFQEAARNELQIIARLQRGVSSAQAASALSAMERQFDATATPGAAVSGTRAVIRTLTETVIGDVRTSMLVLFGAVGLVLLIASANVANLLLVRGEAKRAEWAVRTALGATRRRLIRHVAAESLVVTVLAAIVGLAVTWASLQVLVSLVPGGLPRVDSVEIDAGVVLFVVILSALTTVLAGLVPAIAASGAGLISRVPSGHRVAGRVTTLGRRGLVAAQAALAVMVLVAMGLVTKSLLRLEATAAGLGTDQLVFAALSLPQERYADRARHLQFLDDVVARLEATPTIDAVTPINASPFSGVGWDVPMFIVEGQSAVQAARNGSLNLEAIQPGYFETFDVQVRGRSFDARDGEDSLPVAIVSADVAARAWPGEDAVGKRLKMGNLDSGAEWLTVVGVAARTRYRDLRAPQSTLYVPSSQLVVTAESLVVRSTAPLSQVAQAVREGVRAVDPSVRVPRIVPFDELLQRPLARPRFYSIMLGLFGGSALLLVAVGLYAVIAASVRQRDAEIGVRLALGATPHDVRWMIVREGLWLAVAGAALGLLGAAAATRLLQDLLYEVHPLDPAALIAATLLIITSAIVACGLPAYRAGRMNPLDALRSE